MDSALTKVTESKLVLSPLALVAVKEAERPVQRSRSDSSPVEGRCARAAVEFAEGNAHLSKKSRWNSWSAFPLSQGIPLGSLTAKAAAKPFWNTDMLQRRLDKIVEYATLEAANLDFDGEIEIQDDFQNSIPMTESALEREEQSDEVFDHDDGASATSDDDSLPAESESPILIRNSAAQDTTKAWKERVAHSAADGLKISASSSFKLGSNNNGKPLAVRSAPALIQGDYGETFPIAAIFSRSANIL